MNFNPLVHSENSFTPPQKNHPKGGLWSGLTPAKNEKCKVVLIIGTKFEILNKLTNLPNGVELQIINFE
jgi:hypothetical protein